MPDRLDTELREIARALVAEAPPPPAFPDADRTDERSRRKVRVLVATAGIAAAIGLLMAVAIVRARDDRTVVSVGGVAEPPATGSAPSAPHTCPAPNGSVNDIANEQNWRSFAQYREWTTRDGCRVRIDVLAEWPGPAHCGLSSARVLITGRPVGSRYSNPADELTFVRDPDGVFMQPELTAGFDGHAHLPASAVDTGFRSGSTELWIVPGDNSAVLLKSADNVERWPEGETPRCR